MNGGPDMPGSILPTSPSFATNTTNPAHHDYVVESLGMGWYCRSDSCRVWNSDHKEFLFECRCCRAPRPRRSAFPPKE